MMLKPIGDFKIGWEKSYFKLDSFHGEVTEWLNVAVSKTVVRESVPRVRIPLSPPVYLTLSFFEFVLYKLESEQLLSNIQFRLYLPVW